MSKLTTLKNQEWYKALIEDCQAIITEGIFNYRWTLIKTYHLLGSRILQENDNFEREKIYGEKIVAHVRQSLGKSQSTIWRAIQLARKYPNLDLLPEGKNISWHKIVNKYLPEHKTEINFNYKLFDVWNFQGCDEKYGDPTYPGRIPAQLIKNMLYYFTEEKDLVVDPMAGGGTTIDVCKEMGRGCLAYDIHPFREDIKEWDLRRGFSTEAQNCDLIFLDPPYWKKKKVEYVESSISNLDRKDYLGFFEKLAVDCKETLKTRGILAFLMSNYIDYDNSQQSIFTADYYQFFIKAGFIPLYEIQTPLSTQQYQSYDIERAKKEKKILIISRSLFIFENGKI